MIDRNSGKDDFDKLTGRGDDGPQSMAPARFIAFSVFCLLAVTLTFSLGVWQSYRLSEKNELIARVQRSIHAPVEVIQTEQDALFLNYIENAYRRVQLSGNFLSVRSIFVPTSLPRTYFYDRHKYFSHLKQEEWTGYRVVTPFEMSDGGVILVQVGIIAKSDFDSGIWPAAMDDELRTIKGQLINLDESSNAGSGNDPARRIVMDENPKLDIVRQLALLDRSTARLALRLDAQSVDPINQVSATGDGPYFAPLEPLNGDLPNNHLNYAFTWFGLSLASTIMWVVLFLRQSRFKALKP